MTEPDAPARTLARVALAAFGADPNAHLFVVLAERAPEGSIPTLKADIVRWMLKQQPVPDWVSDALPGIAAAASEALRKRTRILDDVSDRPDAPAYLGDVQDPDWDAGGGIHNWRNYVSDEVREIWRELSPAHRAVLAAAAEEQAGREEHD